MQQKIKVLCTKADRGGLVIEAVLQEIGFLGRNPAKVAVEVVEVDAPRFYLTEARVDLWIKQRAIVIPLVTPALLRNRNLQQTNSSTSTNNFGKLVSASSRTGMTVLPVYCLPVENPDGCCLSSLVWAFAGVPENRKPFPTRRMALSHARGALMLEVNALRDERKNSPRRKGQVEESPLDLAIICAPVERQKVDTAMSLLLPLLRQSGKRYRFIGTSAGAIFANEAQHACSAKHLLIFVSTESQIFSCFWDVIPKIQSDQKVTFVLLQNCLYHTVQEQTPLTLPAPPTWLPAVNAEEVVALEGRNKYKHWFQVLQHLTRQLS